MKLDPSGNAEDVRSRPEADHGRWLEAESARGLDREAGALDGRRRVPRRQLYEMIRDLLRDGVASGAIRADVAPQELAAYCLHALSAARALPSQAAVRRLVAVTLAGVRPPP